LPLLRAFLSKGSNGPFELWGGGNACAHAATGFACPLHV